MTLRRGGGVGRGEPGKDQGQKTFILVLEEKGARMWLMPGSVPGVLHIPWRILIYSLLTFACYGVPGTVLGAGTLG